MQELPPGSTRAAPPSFCLQLPEAIISAIQASKSSKASEPKMPFLTPYVGLSPTEAFGSKSRSFQACSDPRAMGCFWMLGFWLLHRFCNPGTVDCLEAGSVSGSTTPTKSVHWLGSASLSSRFSFRFANLVARCGHNYQCHFSHAHFMGMCRERIVQANTCFTCHNRHPCLSPMPTFNGRPFPLGLREVALWSKECARCGLQYSDMFVHDMYVCSHPPLSAVQDDESSLSSNTRSADSEGLFQLYIARNYPDNFED